MKMKCGIAAVVMAVCVVVGAAGTVTALAADAQEKDGAVLQQNTNVSETKTVVETAADEETGAGTETETSGYGYLTGQRKNADRHAQFSQAASLATDEERESFFEEQGIGGGSYSSAQHLDAGELVEAGVIDQETADRITAYASEKHDSIHSMYGNKSNMTPEERHTFYEGFKSDGFDGDSVSELLNAGIITQEQADSINAYLG